MRESMREWERMWTNHKNHIRVYFSKKSESSSLDKIQSIWRDIVWAWAKVINETGAFFWLIQSKLIKADSKAEIEKVIQEEKWLNKPQKQTIYALYETGEIWKSSVSLDINRWWRKSIAIKDAINLAIKEPYILTFSNGEYTPVSIDQYRKETDGNPEHLNANIVQWVLKMATKTNDPNLYEKYFTRRTLQDLAIYLDWRWYKSRLIPKWVIVKPMMEKLAVERRTAEEGKINPMLAQIQAKFWKSPEVQNAIWILLSKTLRVKLSLKGWNIDLKGMEQDFLSKPENQWKTEQVTLRKMSVAFRGISEKIEKVIKALKQERDKMLKKLWNKNSLWDYPALIKWIDLTVVNSQWQKIELWKEDLRTLKWKYARIILARIGEKYSKDLLPKELMGLVLVLALQSKLKEAENTQWTLVEATKETGGWERINVGKTKCAWQIAVARSDFEDAKAVVWKMTDSQIQKKIITLQNKKNLTEEEKRQLANLLQYKRASEDVAMSYSIAKKTFWEKEAQRIFTQSNQLISNNPQEKYNFDYLDRIATITDPESTPSERTFARLAPGQSISIEHLLERRWDTSVDYHVPEISTIQVLRNIDGTYNIKSSWSLNIEKPLSKQEVKEYLTDIQDYADLWLSQFIPHIPLITEELRGRWVNTAIDGKMSTMEQQKVFKFIYKLLFEKEVITSCLWDVKRAFSSSLGGNPTNMRSAMQSILIENHLISENWWSISSERLKTLIREKNQLPPDYPPI